MGTIRRFVTRVTGDGTLPRYLLTGATISLLDFSLFSLLSIAIGLHPLVANVLATIVSVCVSYLINRRFVFRAERAAWSSFLSFSGVSLINGFVTQSLVIWGVVATAAAFAPGLDTAVVLSGAKVIAMGVGAIANYLGYRFVFRKRGH